MGIVRAFTRTFDTAMFALVGFLLRHPTFTMGACVTGLAVGAGVFTLGVIGSRRAAAKAGAR